MEFNDYQKATEETAIYHAYSERLNGMPTQVQIYWTDMAYCVGKLNGEAGEVAEVFFKSLRDDAGIIRSDRQEILIKELGDVLWYIARIARHLGTTLEEVAEENLDKLLGRKERGKLHGTGHDR